MSAHEYPLARWSVGEKTVGLGVWTRQVPEGSGGGYYMYRWDRSSDVITLKELAEGTTQAERQWGKESVYVTLRTLPVPGSVLELDGRAQEAEVARILYADARERFDGIVEWITYDTFGNPVWFHDEVTKS